MEDCKAYNLWFASNTESEDDVRTFCSLCSSVEYISIPPQPKSTWALYELSEEERSRACIDNDWVGQSFCNCGPSRCERGQFCHNNECHDACSRESCNFHGIDNNPVDGCEDCTCDRHWYGNQCSITDRESISSMKVAFCHPVLFGRTNVTRLNTFLDYYRLLGFDHFYFWTEPDRRVEDFLSRQSDVSVSRFDSEAEISMYGFENFPPRYGGGEADHYHGQNVAIHSCLKQTQAAGYDWVLFGDNDEFLFYHGDFDLRNFLARFSQFSAVSLGKVLHTREVCTETEEENDLFKFLYRAESGFCSEIDFNRDFDNCESYYGRRKYFVQPQYINKLQIHEPTLFEGQMVDVDVNTAHMKEIVGYNQFQECDRTDDAISMQMSYMPADFHGDLSSYFTLDGKLQVVYDFEFENWLQRLYRTSVSAKTIESEIAKFQQYMDKVFEDPCSNDVMLVQNWVTCGFGCSMTAYFSQVLEAYFRGETFVLGRHHLDYARYFQQVFKDEAFPICFEDEIVESKPVLETTNPHDFFVKRIKNADVERRFRPFFHLIASSVWDQLKAPTKSYVADALTQANLPEQYTAMHVRRDDKCLAEANCVGLTQYFDHLQDTSTPVFVMSDEKPDVLEVEVDILLNEVDATVASLRADDVEDLRYLVAEISAAMRGHEIVCTGSSNICRLLWAVSDLSTIIHNVDTNSILCGDARNPECLIKATVDYFNPEFDSSVKQSEFGSMQVESSDVGLKVLEAKVAHSRTIQERRVLQDVVQRAPSAMSTQVPDANDGDSKTDLITSYLPSNCPSNLPTEFPIIYIPPTAFPSSTPSTTSPSTFPSFGPSTKPSNFPTTSQPSSCPSDNPSDFPTVLPTLSPSKYPSIEPSSNPSLEPTLSPTNLPSQSPSLDPISNPTTRPTYAPTGTPTSGPTLHPSLHPTQSPSFQPSQFPSMCPSFFPSSFPTQEPTLFPSNDPSVAPTYDADLITNCLFVTFDFILSGVSKGNFFNTSLITASDLVSLLFTSTSEDSFEYSPPRGTYSACIDGSPHDVYTQILSPSFADEITISLQSEDTFSSLEASDLFLHFNDTRIQLLEGGSVTHAYVSEIGTPVWSNPFLASYSLGGAPTGVFDALYMTGGVRSVSNPGGSDFVLGSPALVSICCSNEVAGNVPNLREFDWQLRAGDWPLNGLSSNDPCHYYDTVLPSGTFSQLHCETSWSSGIFVSKAYECPSFIEFPRSFGNCSVPAFYPSRCETICDEIYVSNSTSFQCGRRGNWEGQEPTCEERPCHNAYFFAEENLNFTLRAFDSDGYYIMQNEDSSCELRYGSNHWVISCEDRAYTSPQVDEDALYDWRLHPLPVLGSLNDWTTSSGEVVSAQILCSNVDVQGFPSNFPSPGPSKQPSFAPSDLPSNCPSNQPTEFPTIYIPPTAFPSHRPTTNSPSTFPSLGPSTKPSNLPTTSQPSSCPSDNPSDFPIVSTTLSPSTYPSIEPSFDPSLDPTFSPTNLPSRSPTLDPTFNPTIFPTYAPTRTPTSEPSFDPSLCPTASPSFQPSHFPSMCPSFFPSSLPTQEPTLFPSNDPSVAPTYDPTRYPSTSPTIFPTTNPTFEPSSLPSNSPSQYPTLNPTDFPTHDPTPYPSKEPTCYPTFPPSSSPSVYPSIEPTLSPTIMPTLCPSICPSKFPSLAPITCSPTQNPSIFPSLNPSFEPTVSGPTSTPSTIPSNSTPTTAPLSSIPTCRPSICPTTFPTMAPSAENPSSAPFTSSPSRYPSSTPTEPRTTQSPSVTPLTSEPTVNPLSRSPSSFPTASSPSFPPISASPSNNPFLSPSISPQTRTTPSSIPTISRPSTTPFITPNLNPTMNPLSPASLPPISSLPSLSPQARTAPSSIPTISRPTKSPSIRPSPLEPTINPLSSSPSSFPTASVPSLLPISSSPSSFPSSIPSCSPQAAIMPSSTLTESLPTGSPSKMPTNSESTMPPLPSSPSHIPSFCPTVNPSSTPSTHFPSTSTFSISAEDPSFSPTLSWPTKFPSEIPFPASGTSSFPSLPPISSSPTIFPMISPSVSPQASNMSSLIPTNSRPMICPSLSPLTSGPTVNPFSSSPLGFPTASSPSFPPISSSPSNVPSALPSTTPQAAMIPSLTPSNHFPTAFSFSIKYPTTTPNQSFFPTLVPSLPPVSSSPSSFPTLMPSLAPQVRIIPSWSPIRSGTTEVPSNVLSDLDPTAAPLSSNPSGTSSSHLPSTSPESRDLTELSHIPSKNPTALGIPSCEPVSAPSLSPTLPLPSMIPTRLTVTSTTTIPSTSPTQSYPSSNPLIMSIPSPSPFAILLPSQEPIYQPSSSPITSIPSSNPTLFPIFSTSTIPSTHPTRSLPSSNPLPTPVRSSSSRSPSTPIPSTRPIHCPSMIPSRGSSSQSPVSNAPTSTTLDELSALPTIQPITSTSSDPSIQPSLSDDPFYVPSRKPSFRPSATKPSMYPVSTPSSSPYSLPSNEPSILISTFEPDATTEAALPPVTEPSMYPVATPSSSPHSLPSNEPSISIATFEPEITTEAALPSIMPTGQTEDIFEPSINPSKNPNTAIPSNKPSIFIETTEPDTTGEEESPSRMPTAETMEPLLPSMSPSKNPVTSSPSNEPSLYVETSEPHTTVEAESPSTIPTVETTEPLLPSMNPSNSDEPSVSPLVFNTFEPSQGPTRALEVRSLRFIQSYDTIAGKEEQFLSECSAHNDPIRCISVVSGSIVVEFEGTSEELDDLSYDVAATGMTLPSFTTLTFSQPSRAPTSLPSPQPSLQPSMSNPSSPPSEHPSAEPTISNPSAAPSDQPSTGPSISVPSFAPLLVLKAFTGTITISSSEAAALNSKELLSNAISSLTNGTGNVTILDFPISIGNATEYEFSVAAIGSEINVVENALRSETLQADIALASEVEILSIYVDTEMPSLAPSEDCTDLRIYGGVCDDPIGTNIVFVMDSDSTATEDQWGSLKRYSSLVLELFNGKTYSFGNVVLGDEPVVSQELNQNFGFQLELNHLISLPQSGGIGDVSSGILAAIEMLDAESGHNRANALVIMIDYETLSTSNTTALCEIDLTLATFDIVLLVAIGLPTAENIEQMNCLTSVNLILRTSYDELILDEETSTLLCAESNPLLGDYTLNTGTYTMNDAILEWETFDSVESSFSGRWVAYNENGDSMYHWSEQTAVPPSGEAWFFQSTPVSIYSKCFPRQVSNTPTLSPSISCVNVELTSCRERHCAMYEQGCHDSCMVLRDQLVSAQNLTVLIVQDELQCEQTCRETPACAAANFWANSTQCWIQYGVISATEMLFSVTSYVCSDWSYPTMYPSTMPSKVPSANPSNAPTADCDAITSESECLEKECAFNRKNGICSSHCEVVRGWLIIGETLGNITTSDLLECERSCRQNMECSTFSYLAGLCYQFSFYQTGYEHPGSISGYCLTYADPSTSPSFSPAINCISIGDGDNCRSHGCAWLTSTMECRDECLRHENTLIYGNYSNVLATLHGVTSEEECETACLAAKECLTYTFYIDSCSLWSGHGKRIGVTGGVTGDCLQSIAPSSSPSTTPTLSPTLNPVSCHGLDSDLCRLRGCAWSPSENTCQDGCYPLEGMLILIGEQLSLSTELSQTGCESFCLENPSCTVYSFFQGTCILWQDYDEFVPVTDALLGFCTNTLIPTQAPIPPTDAPHTSAPSLTPSLLPSQSPSTPAPSVSSPSVSPSISVPTGNPVTQPTRAPNQSPTFPPITSAPTFSAPSQTPTLSHPSLCPTMHPITSAPSIGPSVVPSLQPVSSSPSVMPTSQPSCTPTQNPTQIPSPLPSSNNPTQFPTEVCPTFTNEVECRRNGCSYDISLNRCSDECIVENGQAIIGKPYSASDASDCHSACLSDVACSHAMIFNEHCFLYESIVYFEEDPDATSITCLSQRNPTTSPSHMPSKTPTGFPSTDCSTFHSDELACRQNKCAYNEISQQCSSSNGIESDMFALGTLIASYSDLNSDQCERVCLHDVDCVIFTFMHTICHTFSDVHDTIAVSGSVSGFAFIAGAPTRAPSCAPTKAPSVIPSIGPTTPPSHQPSKTPTSTPSCTPSVKPSASPTTNPSTLPTLPPSRYPSTIPSVNPSHKPTTDTPSHLPSCLPSVQPTGIPSNHPSPANPSTIPSTSPTVIPSHIPSTSPSYRPTTESPSTKPSQIPSVIPSCKPSTSPSQFPTTDTPSRNPSQDPSVIPTHIPSTSPSDCPTSDTPSSNPSQSPTVIPSLVPSTSPTYCPTTDTPSVIPSTSPTFSPSSDTPTAQPSNSPTIQPSPESPTCAPSFGPSTSPSSRPTIDSPSVSPSLSPTESPTEAPTYFCFQMSFTCGSSYDGIYNLNDGEPLGITHSWITEDGRYALFAVDWPPSLGSLSGFRWVFQDLESSNYLVSEESEDEFPHGSMTWIEIHFSTFDAFNVQVCDAATIGCSGSFAPTSHPVQPTHLPSLAPVLNPSSTPSQFPSFYQPLPSSSPTTEQSACTDQIYCNGNGVSLWFTVRDKCLCACFSGFDLPRCESVDTPDPSYNPSISHGMCDMDEFAEYLIEANEPHCETLLAMVQLEITEGLDDACECFGRLDDLMNYPSTLHCYLPFLPYTLYEYFISCQAEFGHATVTNSFPYACVESGRIYAPNQDTGCCSNGACPESCDHREVLTIHDETICSCDRCI